MIAAKPILLALANPDEVLLAESAFREHDLGNSVILVEDGRQVLEYLFRVGEFEHRKTEDPAVILLDRDVRNIDASAVIRVIRSVDYLAGIPVVLLMSSRESREFARDWQVVGAVVVKPFDFQKFIHAVRETGLDLAAWAPRAG